MRSIVEVKMGELSKNSCIKSSKSGRDPTIHIKYKTICSEGYSG